MPPSRPALLRCIRGTATRQRGATAPTPASRPIARRAALESADARAPRTFAFASRRRRRHHHHHHHHGAALARPPARQPLSTARAMPSRHTSPARQGGGAPPPEAATGAATEAATEQHRPPLPPPAPGGGGPPGPEAATAVEVNGAAVRLDGLGPLVVNRDGTASRVANWAEMTEAERQTTLRVLGRRNQLRVEALRAGGGGGDAETKEE